MSTTKKSEYEERRLSLQTDLDAQKSQPERNKLGQFATPTELARDIVSFALSLLPPNDTIRFIDPAIGTGSFFSALLEVTSGKRITIAEGFEIDCHYGLPAKQLWEFSTILKIHLADFTQKTPPTVEKDRFNLLICNPPYVRHHHLSNDEKKRLQVSSAKASGIRIGGLAGLYCYFLTLSHYWLSEKGVAVWLIPSEFMDVNYGEAVRRYLLEKVTLLRIHRFDPNDVQFADALVSSAVVCFRKEKPTSSHIVEFTFGGTLSVPCVSRRIPSKDLRLESKWSRFPSSSLRQRKTSRIMLGDLFTVKRGIATGSNEFFILTRDRIVEHNLPKDFLRPILPSPRYLAQDEVTADDEGTPLLERQLFLLDCRLPETQVRRTFPPLWEYIESGKPDISDRYLCRHRTPWYAQENRPPAPFLCTYIGRSDTKRGRPFRFILNSSKATAANVYLMLYPKKVIADQLRMDRSLLRKVWEILNQLPIEKLLEEGRVYGGGLHKLEPNELLKVSADDLLALLGFSKSLPKEQMNLFE